jgi:cell division protein ZapB
VRGPGKAGQHRKEAQEEFTSILGMVMDILNQLTDKITLLLERQEALKLENSQLKEALEQERQTKEAVLGKVENILNRLQEVDSE